MTPISGRETTARGNKTSTLKGTQVSSDHIPAEIPPCNSSALGTAQVVSTDNGNVVDRHIDTYDARELNPVQDGRQRQHLIPVTASHPQVHLHPTDELSPHACARRYKSHDPRG